MKKVIPPQRALILILGLALVWLPALGDTQQQEAASLLPGAGELAGWSLTGEPKFFPANALWEHINGADGLYLSFGCTSLSVAYFRQDGGQSEIAVEIYRMADELGSFGIYGVERPRDAPFLSIGAQGYQQWGDLNFFGGPYYVKLRVYPDEEAELEAQRRLAGLIAGKPPLAGSSFPKALSSFPTADLVEHSQGVVPEGILGLQGLTRALTAQYLRGETKITLHLVREGDPGSAAKAFSAVCESLGKRSTDKVEPLELEGTQGVRGNLKYHGPVMIFHRGSNIAVISGTDDLAWVKQTAAAVLEAL